jgi:hypothetical protein
LSLTKITSVLTIFFSLLLISCNDDPSPIGSNLLDQDFIRIEQLNSLDDSIMQRSSSRTFQTPLGSSARLFVGRYENIEASFLVRFSISLPDSIKNDLTSNNIIITNSWIELTRDYTFGDTSGVLDLNVKKITSAWTSAGFIADSLEALQTTDLMITPIITDTVTTVTLPNDVALEWLNQSADPMLGTNWGLHISPGPNSTMIYGFQALISSALNVPALRVLIEKPGVYSDTLIYFPLADISVVKELTPLTGGEIIIVQSGVKTISHINFDLSAIPEFVQINKAELVLSSRESMNLIGSDAGVNLQGYIPADTINIDSVGSGRVNFSKNNNLFTANITPAVQAWMTSRNFRGIVITTDNELNGLERFVFWGSDASDVSLRPRLILTYTNKL